MSGATVSALSTHELAKTYGDAPALAPIDLEVAEGERVALLGHNGSGKTTLLRLAAGLLEPTGGVGNRARLRGRFDRGARRATSYLGDQPVFYDDLSVWEHLEYIARLHGHDEWEDHATDLVDTVGLLDRRDDLPMTFSRGLRQKAAITLAFVRPFEILLVDEPFVGLDRTGRDALLDLFQRVHADGAALVVATHELTTVGASAAAGRAARRRTGLRRDARGRRRRRARRPLMAVSPGGPGVTVSTMYEFDSVSVSSYEAASLAAKLSEKSADGWEVVAIVPAGNEVVAYVKRTASDSAAPDTGVSDTARADDGGCGRHRRRRRHRRQR